MLMPDDPPSFSGSKSRTEVESDSHFKIRVINEAAYRSSASAAAVCQPPIK